jgi:hypothetical protein
MLAGTEANTGQPYGYSQEALSSLRALHSNRPVVARMRPFYAGQLVDEVMDDGLEARKKREISVASSCLWRIDGSHELAEEPSVVSAGLTFAGVEPRARNL